MKEIWKDIKGYEGIYQVSNLGRIKSLKRKVSHKRLGAFNVPERILVSVDKGLGYMIVGLFKDNKQKMMRVHRLVAQAFIPNPKNYNLINHKDENPSNNHVDNLEWCDYKYNNNYGNHNKRLSESQSIPVAQYTVKGEFVAKYSGASEAAKKLGIEKVCIRNCCRGEQLTSGGFIWKYESNEGSINANLFKPYKSKMSRETVLKIKELIVKGKSLKDISRLLSVNYNAVSNINVGRTFKYV